jgi:hypothetical protein
MSPSLWFGIHDHVETVEFEIFGVNLVEVFIVLSRVGMKGEFLVFSKCGQVGSEGF